MMNRRRHQIILSVCLLCISFLLCATSAVAWFGMRHRTGSIQIKSGEVTAEFVLYKYDDFNQDGLPDYDFIKKEYIFHEVDNQRIEIDNFQPGDTHTYRIEVTNTSTNRAIYNIVDVHYDTTAPLILGEVIKVGRRYENAAGVLQEVTKVISVANKAGDGTYVRLGSSADVIAERGTSILDLYITFMTDIPGANYNSYQNVRFSIPKIDIALIQG